MKRYTFLLLFLFGFNFCNISVSVGEVSYHRIYDNYQPNMFNFYFGLDLAYNVIDYKLKEARYKFSNRFFAEKFLIGSDIDNLFKLEAFYQYAPNRMGSIVSMSSPEHIINTISLFGLDIIPYIKLNKYFDVISSIGVVKHVIKATSFAKIDKSKGNGFKFGIGAVAHINNNIDLRVMCNQLVFSGYSDMSSVLIPSIGFVFNF